MSFPGIKLYYDKGTNRTLAVRPVLVGLHLLLLHKLCDHHNNANLPKNMYVQTFLDIHLLFNYHVPEVVIADWLRSLGGDEGLATAIEHNLASIDVVGPVLNLK